MKLIILLLGITAGACSGHRVAPSTQPNMDTVYQQLSEKCTARPAQLRELMVGGARTVQDRTGMAMESDLFAVVVNNFLAESKQADCTAVVNLLSGAILPNGPSVTAAS